MTSTTRGFQGQRNIYRTNAISTLVYNKQAHLKYLKSPYKQTGRKKRTRALRRVRGRISAINAATRRKGDFIQSKYQYRQKIQMAVRTPKVYYYGGNLKAIRDTLLTLDEFVMKPNHLSRGIGIRVLTRDGETFYDTNGDVLTVDDLMDEIRILLALRRYKGARALLLEERIKSHKSFGSNGMADVRFIFFRKTPLFCIPRISNAESGGYGNTARGAKWGAVIGGVYVNDKRFLSTTIKTGKLPFYSKMVAAGKKVTSLFGMAFMSVDMTVNEAGEVVVLESEALPQIEYYLTDKGARWLMRRLGTRGIKMRTTKRLKRRGSLSKYFKGRVRVAK